MVRYLAVASALVVLLVAAPALAQSDSSDDRGPAHYSVYAGAYWGEDEAQRVLDWLGDSFAEAALVQQTGTDMWLVKLLSTTDFDAAMAQHWAMIDAGYEGFVTRSYPDARPSAASDGD